MQIYRGNLSRNQLYRRVKSGEITRLAHGMHVWGAPTHPEVARALGEFGLALTGLSLLQLLKGEPLTRPLNVSVPHERKLKDTTWLCFHRTRTGGTTIYDGVRIQLPLLAARTLSEGFAIELLNAAYAGRKEGRARLEGHRKAVRGKVGARGLRYLRQAAVGADSPPERDLVEALEGEGVPTASNEKVGDYHWDIWVRGTNVLIEVDGYKYHRAEDRKGFCLDRWKAVDAALRGYTVLRFAATCIKHERESVVKAVIEAVDKARKRPTEPAVQYWHRGVWRWHQYFLQTHAPVW